MIGAERHTCSERGGLENAVHAIGKPAADIGEAGVLIQRKKFADGIDKDGAFTIIAFDARDSAADGIRAWLLGGLVVSRGS